MSVEVVLAVVGSVLALVAVALPWYTVSADDLGRGMWSASVILGEPASPELDAMLRSGAPSIAAGLREGLVGYKLEHATGFAVRALVMLAALGVAVMVRRDRLFGMVPFAVFLTAAAAAVIRPATYLLEPPGLKFQTLYHHAPGLYLSFLAGACLLAAALLARSDPRATARAAGTDHAPDLATDLATDRAAALGRAA